MKINIKKIVAILTLVSVVCLDACSDNSAKETTTATIAPETTVSVEQTKKDLSRVVEVPYGEYKATFTFNEKGLLASSEGCPWGNDNDYYKYDEQNRIIEIQHALWDGTIDESCERKIYTYDEEGNLSEFAIYNGPKEKLVRFRVHNYEYSNGQLIKETERAGGNNKIIETIDYEYNADGNLIKKTEKSSYGTVTETLYEYDSQGNQIKYTSKNDMAKYIGIFTYDANGNCTSSEYTDYNGETITNKSSYKFEYDNEGVITKEYFTQTIYNPESETEEISAETTYIYENGLLLKKVADDSIVEYEYHDNNRIVTRYWGGKEEPDEINIDAVPELMGNYENLPL